MKSNRGRDLPKRDTGKDERKHLTGLEGEKLLAAATGTPHAARELFASGARELRLQGQARRTALVVSLD